MVNIKLMLNVPLTMLSQCKTWIVAKNVQFSALTNINYANEYDNSMCLLGI